MIYATASPGNVVVIERKVDLGLSSDRTTIKITSDVPVTVQRSSDADFCWDSSPVSCFSMGGRVRAVVRIRISRGRGDSPRRCKGEGEC